MRHVPSEGEDDVLSESGATARRRLLCWANQGAGSNDEQRLVALVADLDAAIYPFERRRRLSNVPRILGAARRERADLLVMEGTSIVGGLAVLIARLVLGLPFVVSSGDAVGPYLGGRRRALAIPGWCYEWLLCRASSGYIGWTPYLVGRALTLGAPRGMTAANFASPMQPGNGRDEVRRELGISADATVFGLVGALEWNPRRRYCYGLELVSALRQTSRDDVAVLVVGDGSGLRHLEQMAGDELGRRVFLPGRVERDVVPTYLAAMDVGSLPQSVDQVGSFRYTTKLSEYAAAGLPVVTGQIPAAYDLLDGACWSLPGRTPWSPAYVGALAGLMERLDDDELAARRAEVGAEAAVFDLGLQRRRVTRFLTDVLAERAAQA
jgi:glycosyltransferase involved in cell wall biosynthesis